MAIFKKKSKGAILTPYDKADAVLNEAFSAFHVARQGTADAIAVLEDHTQTQEQLIAIANAEKALAAEKIAANKKLHDKLADFLS